MSIKFQHAVPILYSENVTRSLIYYTEVLGFEGKWDWGNPPDFGGVHKNGVEIYFCEKAMGSPGTWLSILINNVDEFYETLKARGAHIIAPPKSFEWGMREMLVEDPDGHRIRFGQGISTASDREKSESSMPSTVRIAARKPTAKESESLFPGEPVMEAASSVVYAAVAEDTATGKVIGAVSVLGDKNNYYIKGLQVDPQWQGKRIGSALMQAVTDWLEENAPHKAYVGLHTAENLAPFYRQFGFAPAYGMYREIFREEKNK